MNEESLNQTPAPGPKMPVLFVGHGSPMNVIEDSRFTRAWEEQAARIPRPSAILCISAHWETDGTRVTALRKPITIHDFSGFPQELSLKQYPAPGSPELALAIQKLSREERIDEDFEWGLDHGSWGVLCRMYPDADIPVVQLSLDEAKTAALHYRMGKLLSPLRRQGVLVLASGNIVHNLGTIRWDDSAYEWAQEFDEIVKNRILQGDHKSLMQLRELGPSSIPSVPTTEHYMPLMYALALQEEGDSMEFFAEGVTMGSLSMRSVRIG
jgi:4,5-DOPA dioxygenase extradiol